MKKSTKIIATVIALVLVMSFMVVGILAATSASASITATVSWTAEAGVNFTLDAWTWQSAEHYNSTNKNFPTISPHMIDRVTVDSQTTNETASGISKSLNASFVDTTDDGVNNPLELYYVYFIRNTNQSVGYNDNDASNVYHNINVKVASCPQTTSEVLVEWAYATRLDDFGNGEIGNLYPESWFESYQTTETVVKTDKSINSVISETDEYFEILGHCYVMRLTLLNPDTSLTGFNANVSFTITLGSQYMA